MSKAAPISPVRIRIVRSDGEMLEQGFKAFRKEQFQEAIEAWGSPSLAGQPRVKPILAEARFRQALGRPDNGEAIRELRLATGAVPEEGRYWYHLGLALYRERDLEGAQEALAGAARHGFQRREPLAYLQGLLALEWDPSLAEQEDGPELLAPIRALLRQDWAALAAGAPLPAVTHAKGTPVVSGMASLLRGIGQAGQSQWPQAVQTLGSLSQDLFPGPLEALRVVFLARALDGVGRSAEGRKLRKAALIRTKNPTLGAEAGRELLAELEAGLAQGRWPEVAAGAQELLKSAPSPRARVVAATALDHLGREAAAAGRWEEAGRHWSALLKAGGEDLPGLAAIHHNLALAHEGQERWDPAASAWEAALAALPRRITKAQIKAGTAYGGLSPEALLARRAWIERRALDLRRRTGNVEAVLRQRKTLLKRDPGNLDLRLEQVDLLISTDKLRAAERELQAILRQAPDHPGALEARARIQLEEGFPTAATVTLRRVLALEPGRVSARTVLAHTLAEQTMYLPGGRHREAVGMLEEAIALAPKEGGLHLSLAARHLNGGARDLARAQVKEALRLGRQAWAEVFRFWARHRELEEARSLVAEGEALGVLDAAFFLASGLVCLQVAEDLERALPVAAPRRATRKGAKAKDGRSADCQAWGAFARSFLEKGAALELDGQVLTDLVGSLLARHPDLALPFAEKAAGLDPGNPSVLMDLAVAQSGARQFEAARRTLLKVEKAARGYQGTEDVASILSMLRVIPVVGVEALYPIFSEAMLDGLGPGDPDFDDEGIPY